MKVALSNETPLGETEHVLVVQSTTRGTVYVPSGEVRHFSLLPDEILVLRGSAAKEPTGVPLDIPPESQHFHEPQGDDNAGRS